MGKTASGAIWLNKDLLSEYDYWQFWRNTDDADVIRFLKVKRILSLSVNLTCSKSSFSNLSKGKLRMKQMFRIQIELARKWGLRVNIF